MLTPPATAVAVKLGAMPSRAVRGKAIGAALVDTSAGRVGRRAVLRFIELEGFDRAMALAGQAFAALLPLLIVLGVLSPGDGRGLSETLIREFRLSGDTADTIKAAVGPSTSLRSIGVLGGVLLVVSALSFTRALQRLYFRAWRAERMGLRANLFGLLWLVVFTLFWLALPVVENATDGVAGFVVSFGLSTALWLVTPWLLLGRTLSWRRLLPQALITAGGLVLFGIGSALYMPRAIGRTALEFGFIGVAFALLSWLFALALVLVTAAAVGSVLEEDPAHGRAVSPDDTTQPA